MGGTMLWCSLFLHFESLIHAFSYRTWVSGYPPKSATNLQDTVVFVHCRKWALKKGVCPSKSLLTPALLYLFNCVRKPSSQNSLGE